MKSAITFDEFTAISDKLEIRIGTIKSVEPMPKSDKMLKMQVSFGDGNIKTCMTNIGNRLKDPQDLVLVQLPFIMNLEPAKLMGVMSEVMIMIGESDGKLEYEQYTDGSKLM